MKTDSRGSLWRARWAAVGAAVAVTLGAGGLLIAHAASPGASAFVAVTPCRLIDTRPGFVIGPRSTPIGPGETATFAVRGSNGSCSGIPSDATGVAANVTVTDGTSNSFLTIWPSDASRPNASTNNWVPGQAPTPNKVDVKLSATGSISVFNNTGTVHLIIDVVGFYEPSGGGTTGLSGRQVVTKAGTAPANGFLADTADCPAGKVPIGGGVIATTSPVFSTNRVVQSGIFGNGWLVVVENTSASVAVTYTIQVVCVTP